MAENSKIEWTHHTFNPWRGCTKISPGCAHCYAATLSLRNPKTLGTWGDAGTRVVAAESYWRQPLKWDRKAREAGERRRVFCASLADVFEDWTGPMVDVTGTELCACHGCGDWVWYNQLDCRNKSCREERLPRRLTMDDVRARLFGLIDATPNLDWLLLTKRPENVGPMLTEIQAHGGRYAEAPWCMAGRWIMDGDPPANVWLGVSVEDQRRKDRIDVLRATPAAVRFLSVEPLLEDLGRLDLRGISWVIVGGESGPHARPMHPDWPRSIRDQCQAAGVPFFFKQWGEWAPVVRYIDGMAYTTNRAGEPTGPRIADSFTFPDGQEMIRTGKRAAGRLLDGREWSEFPEVTHA